MQMTVMGLAARTGSMGSLWNAQVTITIRNLATGGPMANATVTGTFGTGTNVNCLTASTGACTVTSPTFRRAGTAAAVYTVTNVVAPNATYVPSQNTATQLRINRP
jgi:hypothetical protein